MLRYCIIRIVTNASNCDRLRSYIKIGRISAATPFRTAQIQNHRYFNASQCLYSDLYSFTDGCFDGRNTDKFEPNRIEDVIVHIERWFDCSYEEAARILNKTPHLRSSHLETMDGYVEFLKGNGITVELLRRNRWLFEHSITTIRPKLRLLSKLGMNSNTVPLLKVGRTSLRLYILRNGTSDLDARIAFLSQSLNCLLEEVGDLVTRERSWFLLTMQYDRLVCKTGLLLDHGVAPSDIRNDLRVYKNDEEHLRDRLCRATAAGVELIKPWMLRCTEHNFRTLLERRQRYKRDDPLEYLSERLGHDHREILSLVKRCSMLTSMSVVKMKNVFDLLYSKGISSEQIYRYPVILGHRLDLLDSRLKEIESFGLGAPQRLHVLGLPQRKYDNALREMIRNDAEAK